MPCPRYFAVNAMDNDQGTGRRPVPRLRYLAAVTTLPPLPVQSFSVLASTQPLPLQSFLPLHALSAPEQAPLPLHSLMPAHLTVFDAAFSVLPLACFAYAAPAANMVATADAITAPLMTSFNMKALLS